ncbi:holo-ACP synthase [Zongyangia hominis]|uniref:Holo-[acyl-carrier-protein] synthase n=1 Tax=Zongyangia hominis TaxID=2763677 RepID=A0A926IBH0_9FIRM|nr:holo-ACP synthase [Zongyangia hominis]MBC8570090.1 holo-ACP synthase [Zongyangia hominis]
MLCSGIDLIEIKRMGRCSHREHFMERVFSSEERALFAGKKEPLPTIAANFAAKEAFAKALGTGVRGFALREVSALRDTLGRPYLHLTGRAEALARRMGLRFSVSMSHTKAYAVCVVIAYTEESSNQEEK